MKASRKLSSVLLAALLPLAFVMVSCDADSPTAPASQAQNPSTGETQATTWNVTVTVSPDIFTIDDDATTGFVTVTATRASNGAAVAQGTTAVLSTSGGVLTSASGNPGSSIPIEFDETGSARATLSVAGFNTPGTIVVRAQLESSFGSASVRLVESPDDTTGAFGLTELSPSFGPPIGGTLVTVIGSNFGFPMKAALCESTNVTTSLSDCVSMTEISVLSSTTFTAVTPRIDLPAGQDLTLNLIVEKVGGENSFGGVDSLPNAFTYTRNETGPAQLLLISVTPTSGPNQGGTQVTIRGDGFNQEAQVFFTSGPLVEATVLEVSRTRILAVTPSATGPNADNANSIVDVIVRDPVSGQQATLTGAFQYGAGASGLFISSVGPSQVEHLGGQRVTVFGQGFDEPVAVSAGGVAQTPISVTGTEIAFNASSVTLTGCGSQTGAVSVTNIETAETVSGPDFEYLPVSFNLTGLDTEDSFGSGAGGKTIEVRASGRAFGRGLPGDRDDYEVLVDGKTARVTGVSSTGSESILTIVTPAYAGEYEDEDCTVGGEPGTQPGPVFVDIEVTNLTNGCADTSTRAFRYDPPNPVCVADSAGSGGGGSATGPTASFTTAAAGLTVDFTDTSTAGDAPIVDWDWAFGDGATSGGQNPTHVYAAAGTYNVTLTVTDGGLQSDTVAMSVTVP